MPIFIGQIQPNHKVRLVSEEGAMAFNDTYSVSVIQANQARRFYRFWNPT